MPKIPERLKPNVSKTNAMTVSSASANGTISTAANPNRESILSQFARPVSDLVNKWLKVLIYGINRVGKTCLACQFEKPLLLMSYEINPTGGALSVRDYPATTSLKMASSKMSQMLANQLMEDRRSNWKLEGGKWKELFEMVGGVKVPLFIGDPFKTVVSDTITSYQDILLAELMNWPTVPDQLAWGTVPEGVYQQRSEKLRECLRPFVNLPMHTIFLAKEKDHNPPKGERNKYVRSLGQPESFFGASVGTATADWLNDACDFMTRLSVENEVEEITETEAGGVKLEEPIKFLKETGKTIRRLRTQLHKNYAAGIRSPKYENVPEYVDGANPELMFANFMKIVRGM